LKDRENRRKNREIAESKPSFDTEDTKVNGGAQRKTRAGAGNAAAAAGPGPGAGGAAGDGQATAGAPEEGREVEAAGLGGLPRRSYEETAALVREVFEISPPAVSRRFIKARARNLKELMERALIQE